ncbi:hypothetical protein PUN28_019331 [Cardiocondyla obscurior]|uniref:Uncharacterized protein n=1 Tax=Cardiocondyla obscurior TaxID=286306 RepID=A0AAW2EEW6_9HYME
MKSAVPSGGRSTADSKSNGIIDTVCDSVFAVNSSRLRSAAINETSATPAIRLTSRLPPKRVSGSLIARWEEVDEVARSSVITSVSAELGFVSCDLSASTSASASASQAESAITLPSSTRPAEHLSSGLMLRGADLIASSRTQLIGRCSTPAPIIFLSLRLGSRLFPNCHWLLGKLIARLPLGSRREIVRLMSSGDLCIYLVLYISR